MKIQKLIPILFLSLLAIGAVGSFLTKNRMAPSHHEQANIYYCPMHPSYTADKPGLCPICNMSLVKKENTSDVSKSSVSGYSTVSINSDQQKLLGVKTATVVKKPFIKTVFATGNFVHDLELYQAALEYIDAWQDYRILRSRRIAGEEFKNAYTRFLKTEYELQHLGLNQDELDHLRAIRLRAVKLTPDLSAASSKTPQEIAETFLPSQHTSELAFLHETLNSFIYAQVAEADIHLIREGQKAHIEIPALKGTLLGEVHGISSQVDKETRKVKVRIRLFAHTTDLKADMYANVYIPIESAESLLVPRDAVLMTGTRSIVFVKTENDFEPKEITVGEENSEWVVVLDGLKENDVVVSGANFLVDSESRLKAALGGSHVH
ncbi:MAG: efflux RND transporter periplasmic adaptor subunit [Candidatus Omnitrophota bacterium]